ncbi:MAG: Maf family nucleotide pyrophosphatase [Parvularculaceae bacterium]|nr:Maf family nucleotide pyrophosphatase [Parvularculaceae bacterium]
MTKALRLVLASASPRRLDILRMIGVEPDTVAAADLDESERKGELVRDYVSRLATEKAAAVAVRAPDALVLAADTAVACGRRILPKAETVEQARDCLDLLSGRAHRVWTGVALAGPGAPLRLRAVESRVRVARLTPREIDDYLASEEWRGKAGGYAIQGRFARHVEAIIGSHTNIVGLPARETYNLLKGAGLIAA